MTEYEPEYAPGEIIIHPERSHGQEETGLTIQYIFGFLQGNLKGIQAMRSSSHSDQYGPLHPHNSRPPYIVTVPTGLEDAYCEQINELDIIESAYRRDLAFERRQETLDTIVSMVSDMRDHVEVSTQDYQAKLDEIIDYIATHNT